MCVQRSLHHADEIVTEKEHELQCLKGSTFLNMRERGGGGREVDSNIQCIGYPCLHIYPIRLTLLHTQACVSISIVHIQPQAHIIADAEI